MTVVVSKSAETLNEGIDNLIQAMKNDYLLSENTKEYSISEGRKYIKIIQDSSHGFSSQSSVVAFVVKQKTKKFEVGDLLLPKSWNSPATNFARGNVLEGNYPVQWTGPMYG